MNIEIDIADVRLLIKRGRDFINALNPVEKKLLAPFIVRISSGRKNGNAVTVNARYIDSSNPLVRYRVESNLLELIKSYFYKYDSDFDKVFNNYLKGILVPYLSENASNQERLKALLKDGRNGNKIIIRNGSFGIYDSRKKCYELLYRKMIYLPGLCTNNIMHIKSLFRMILNSKKDGAIFHAASIGHGGNGYIFLGPGNSGKSTVVKMLAPDRILSDDAAVIRRVRNTYNIYPNPWWNGRGKISIADPLLPVPLKAIFFIRKSKKTVIKRLSYKEALSTLIYGDASFQQAAFFDNKEGIKDFYLFAQRLMSEIPAFKLQIKKSPRFKESFYKLVDFYFKK